MTAFDCMPPRWKDETSQIPMVVIPLDEQVTVALYADGAACADFRQFPVARRSMTGRIEIMPDGVLGYLTLSDGVTTGELPERLLRATENAARKQIAVARRTLIQVQRAQRRTRAVRAE